MLFLVTGGVLALLAAVASAVLFLKLPFWKAIAGISSMSAERRAKVDAEALAICLALLFMALSLLLAVLTLLLYFQVITEAGLFGLALGSTIVFFNLFAFCFRFFDKNKYSRRSKFYALVFQLSFTAVLIALLIVSFP